MKQPIDRHLFQIINLPPLNLTIHLTKIPIRSITQQIHDLNIGFLTKNKQFILLYLCHHLLEDVQTKFEVYTEDGLSGYAFLCIEVFLIVATTSNGYLLIREYAEFCFRKLCLLFNLWDILVNLWTLFFYDIITNTSNTYT